MADTPQPQAVDYSGRPLHEGDTVAFISHDPISLNSGRIRAISPCNICIEAGPHLVTFGGRPASLGMPRPRPIGGTVERDKDAEEPFLYSQVALQPAEDGA